MFTFNSLKKRSKRLNYWSLLVLLITICNVNAFAQTGPGGVGNATGINSQPENLIWLDASTLSSFGDGATWADQSGNGFNATHIGAATTAPTWGAAVIGGKPALQFLSTKAGYLRILDDPRLDNTSKLTVIAVFNAKAPDTRAIISKRLTSTASLRSWSLFYNSGYKLNVYAGASAGAGTSSLLATPSISTYVLNSSITLFNNGTQEYSSGSGITIPDRTDNVTIGVFDEADNGIRNFAGDIAEIIVYRSALTKAQRVIVESYLARKYGITIATNVFAGGDGSFIKDAAGFGVEADGTQALASSQGLYVSGVGAANGDYVMAAHDGTANSVSSSAAITSSGAQAGWSRAWYVQKTGTPTVHLSFDFSEGIAGQFPQAMSNYVLLRKDTPTGNYTQVSSVLKGVESGDRVYFDVSSANFTNGYYTLGTLNQTASPLDGGGRKIWYTLFSSADWDNPDAWTLDACGCTVNNPGGYTPITSPTASSDKVVILSGKKMTVPVGVNNLRNAELVVYGELDLKSSTGHAFASIQGSGLISMSADNFPEGDASNFVTSGEGQGKVQFYGSGFAITTPRTFYNVNVILDTPTSSINLKSSLTTNGNLRIERGIVTINDNNVTSTTPINTTVHGELYLASPGQLLVGTANARHQLNLYGDFFNDGGTAKFTQRSAVNYTAEATDGMVDVNFLNATKNQLITCNGITNFYRVEIDKGVDKTYMASFNASSTNNFKLYGPANYNIDGAQLPNNNAFGLQKGTARLGQNVVVNQLNTTGNYSIFETASLWIDGGSATKSSGTAITPYGELKVSAGTFTASVSSGITLRDNGVINIQGGVLTTNQIRTSVLGSQHQGGYVQSGGVANVTGGSTNADYYVFNLTYEGNTFQMSGGTLNVSNANTKGGIFINSSPANYSVTGGVVNCNISNTSDFVITSTAPFYNLNMTKTVSNSAIFVLKEGANVGSTFVNLAAQPLKVLNDFRIFGEESGVGYPDITFAAVTSPTNINDVYVGGSLFFEEGVTYGFANGGTYPYDSTNKQPTSVNTTFFNQTIATSAIDTIYWGHKGGADNDLDNNQRFELGHFVLNRTSGNQIRTVGRSNLKNAQIFIDVNGNATVESGTLDQGRMTFRTWGKIVNKDRMGTWYGSGTYPVSGGTPSTAQIRFREDADVEVQTTTGAIFGNLRFNVNPGSTHVALTSDMTIERMEYTRGAIYLKGYNLKIDNIWNINSNANESFVDIANSDELKVLNVGISGNKLIYTDGKSSDGGLSLKVTGNTLNENGGRRDRNESPMSYLIGYTTDGGTTVYNRPAQMKVKNFSDDGYVTIRPVAGVLQTTNATGNKELLQNYWRVTHSDFTTVPTVAFQFYYRDQTGVTNVDKVTGAVQEANYVPGYVLGDSPYTRVSQADASDIAGKTAGATRRIVFNGTTTGGDFTQAGFAGFTLVNASFTTGESARFTGAPLVYYNKRNNAGNWNANSSWYMDADQTIAATNYPKAGDIAILRGDDYNDNITVNGTQTCAEVVFQREGTYVDIESMPRLRFNSSDVLNVGRVSGEGDIYLQQKVAQMATLNGDIGDFAKIETSVIEFYMTENGSYSVNLANFFAEVPTLRIYGNTSANRFVTFNYDLKCKNLVVDGYGRLDIGGNYEVENLTRLGFTNYGRIQFPNGATPYTFKTKDFKTVTGKNGNPETYSLDVATGNANAVKHRMVVTGDIDLNFRQTNAANSMVFDLYNSPTENNVILELSGDGAKSFVNNFSPAQSTIQLYQVKMNKGSDVNSSFTFKNNFSLALPTATHKPVDLTNGLLVLDNASINIDLADTGSGAFAIPGAAGLEVKQGTANIKNAQGLSLDGLLKVSGGTFDMTGGDNPIIYSVSGKAAIVVSAGTLKVGSQIRRPETDDLGVLKYTQTGGTVEIGVSSGGLASRGMLEVLNTGSLFKHTGGNLTLVRQNTAAPTRSALYLEPASYDLSGSTITLFNATTPAAQTKFGINSSIALNNLVINGTNTPMVDLRIRPLYLNGNLTIGSGATLDAKGFAIDLKGNWINNGTFTPSANEVIFSGTSPQTTSGVTTFSTMTKNGTAPLTLGADITVDYQLNLNSGIIDDNDKTIYVKRNILNNGTFISGSGNGVVLNGTSEQLIYGNGTYDKMHLNNASGFRQYDGNVITINKNLKMESGLIYIGKNLMVFEAAATITPVTPFSTTNMIKTDISFVDAGIKKFLPTGALLFTYPLGSGDAYTPVTLNITNNTATGAYLRMKGANEVHPSVIENPTTPFVDVNNVLQYYWVVDANGLSDMKGNISMAYPFSLVKVDGGNLYSNYITARLLSRGTGLWNKNVGAVNTVANTLTFDFSLATADDGLIGDYTAGINAAIPDQVPTYTSVQNGNWDDVNTWSPVAPTGGPRGAMVIVKHDVTMRYNFMSSYKTTIIDDAVFDGRILIPGTEGHRLGNVLGTGTIYLETGGLPAGDYTTFLGASGGTVEFSGLDKTYPVLSGISTVNNLKFSGSGVRNLPNANLQILGKLTIEKTGLGAGLLVDNASDKLISVKGDVVYNSGTFDAGTGTGSGFVFNGTSNQHVRGTASFTGGNSFYNLTVDNSAGVTLETPTEVKRVLSLNNGILNAQAGSLTLTYSEAAAIVGGGASSFVEGPLNKYINQNQDFNFPVGKSGRYGVVQLLNTSTYGLWTAEYYNTGINRDNFTGNVKFIYNEYWKVKGPDLATSKVKVRWDAETGVPSSSAERANLRIVERKTGGFVWNEVGGPIADAVANGTITLTNPTTYNAYTDGNYFSIGSVVLNTTNWIGLTNDWSVATNWSTGAVPSGSTDVVIPTTPSGGAGFPVLNGGTLSVNKLTIQTGAKLTLKPGTRANLNDVTTIAGTGQLVIENTVSQPTSLINYKPISGSITSKWNYNQMRFWYIGFPVTPSYNDFVNNLTVSGTPVNSLFQLNHWTGSAWNVLSNTIGFNAIMRDLQGINVYLKDDASVAYTGALHDGDYTIPLTNAWLLVGNPYAAYIDVERSDVQFGSALKSTWVTTTSGSERVFAIYNVQTDLSVNGGSRYIAPGQAFWVRSYEAGIFGINKGARLHSVGSLKSATQDESDVLRMSLTNSFASDEAVIAFRSVGSYNKSNIDSEKRYDSGSKAPALYSLKGNDVLAISIMPDAKIMDEIPLGMVVTSKTPAEVGGDVNVDFNISNIESFMPGTPVYLVDKETGITQNMRSVPTYRFVSKAGTFNDRFVLKFQGIATDVKELLEDETATSAGIDITGVENRVTVKVNSTLYQQQVAVRIYSVLGELIVADSFAGSSKEYVLPSTSGHFVVRVLCKNANGDQIDKRALVRVVN